MKGERFLLLFWLPIVLGLYEIGALDVLVTGIVLLGFGEILYRRPHSKVTAISMFHMAGFLLILLLREHDVWFLLFVVASNDMAGYFIGSQLKSKLAAHPFPKLSPKKTIGGYFSGIVIGTMIGIATANYFKLPYWYHLLALMICLLAGAGDLLNSKFKRFYKIKDSGQGLFTEGLLFGHGGVYDRFDAISLACMGWGFFGFLRFV